jgi:hypothetical protein
LNDVRKIIEFRDKIVVEDHLPQHFHFIQSHARIP